MNQKVKLQVTSDVLDVPRLSAALLQEAIIESAKLQQFLQQLSSSLKDIDLVKENELEKLKYILKDMDFIRLLLSKIDNRGSDTASILSGLISILENPESFQNESENDDNVSSG